MKKFIIRLLIILATIIPSLNSAKAQSCDQFVKSVPGNMKRAVYQENLASRNYEGDMVFDSNNNLYLTGSNLYFISKYTKDGNLKWNKTKTGLVAVDAEIYNQFVYATAKGALLCKFDTTGNELFTPVNISNTEPTSMCLDASGNIYITGLVRGTAVFGTSTYTTGKFVVKYNSNGQLIWSKNILSANISNPTSVANVTTKIISDGSFIYSSIPATGSAPNSTVNISVGTQTYNIVIPTYTNTIYAGLCFLTKSDLNGNIVWIKFKEQIYDMTFDNQGKIVAGLYGKCQLLDTTGALINTHAFANDAIHHVKTFNNKYIFSLNNPLNFLIMGDFSNSTYSSLTIFGTSSNTFSGGSGSHYVLPNFDKNGRLYCAFGTDITTSQGYIDEVKLNGSNTNLILAKYNINHKLLPEYISQNIICGQDSVQLGYTNFQTFPGNIPVTTFNWLPAAGLSSTSIHNPKAKPSITTIYTVTVNGACPITVSVGINNPSAFAYTTNSMTATFNLTGTGCNTFLWDFGNGNTSTLNPNPIVTYATAGTYGVCLQCNGQPTNCVKCFNITVPSNTSNGVGIEEIDNTDGISIYPNPSTGILNIELTNFIETDITLYNTNGQCVYAKKLYSNVSAIDLSDFSSGIYSLHFKNSTGIKVQKIILNR